jgi:hypothetical protein
VRRDWKAPRQLRRDIKELPNEARSNKVMALQEVGQSTCGSSLGDPRYMKNGHFETKEAAVPDRRAELLDKVADYILSNGLADLSLRPLATAIDTSPRMLLYFFGSKERLIAEALAHIRTREQLDFKRAVSRPKPADRLESLLRDWRSLD